MPNAQCLNPHQVAQVNKATAAQKVAEQRQREAEAMQKVSPNTLTHEACTPNTLTP